ncbi:MAG TPA: HAD family hydrolase [Chitinispirillaceae bacterium]|jgi:phosphoglycolate phosphatase|nr:HAD family hydrolase [Chitinispirillaceae bacterium]
MMKFKAAIFDLDGTLLNTLQDIADSMNEVLKNNGFPQHEAEAYKLFVGEGMRTLVRKVLPEKERVDTVIEKCLSEMRRTYGSGWAEKTRPYDGIESMLKWLKENGLRLSVLSNKPHEFTLKSIRHFFEESIFEIVLGAGKFPDKPDPASAIYISEQMGIPPSQFIYLGDSGIDMATATGAGMFAVGVLWGFRGREELTLSGANLLVSSPGELIEFLENS